MITFTVPGNPIPKQRPRTTWRRRKAYTYTPQKTKDYEKLVGLFARRAMDGQLPIQNDVAIYIHFFRKDKRRADGDNMEKSVVDAIIGVVIVDDNQVVHCRWTKSYDKKNPRVEVAIEELEQSWRSRMMDVARKLKWIFVKHPTRVWDKRPVH